MPRSLRGPVLLASALVLACATLAACGSSGSLAPFGGSLPTVGGSAASPTITFPDTKPPTTLHVHVLVQGHGAVVHHGDLLVVNYVGQIWRGKVFDSSFARRTPSGFQIGVGQVIPAWDDALVGQRVGARLLIVAPPADGYGAKGQAQAGITGTDTLTFVVDVLGTFPKTSVPAGRLAPVSTTVKGVTVDWSGVQPVVHVVAGTVHPKTPNVTVLSRGSGPTLRSGLVILQYVVADLATGKVVQSTWSTVPDGETVGGAAQQTVLNQLLGLPEGSRVLILLPKGSSGGPYAIVGEVVAGFPTT